MVIKLALQHKRPTSSAYVAKESTPSYHCVQPIQDFSDNPPTAPQDHRESISVSTRVLWPKLSKQWGFSGASDSLHYSAR